MAAFISAFRTVSRVQTRSKFFLGAKHLAPISLTNSNLPNFGQYHVRNNLLLSRNYCSTTKMESKEVKRVEETKQAEPLASPSLRQKFKSAVAEYGTTVIVFHIGFALCSLGTLYLIISSGVDMQAFLSKFLSEDTSTKITANAGTFALAYAINKLISPIRIGITLTATPFIVRYLRKIGFIKHQGKKIK